MLATRMRMSSEGKLEPFGGNPGALTGVSFYDGTSEVGMIVYKTAGTYTLPCLVATTVEYLVVAGGAGSGKSTAYVNEHAGAGGAGGRRYSASTSLTTGDKTVTVGTGGAGATEYNVKGTNGSNSVLSTITATGGGGGGSHQTRTGASGGSGGGAAIDGTSTSSGGSGSSGQGNNGAASVVDGFDFYGGGGGGSGAAGSNNNGGAGTSTFGFTYCTGGAAYLRGGSGGTQGTGSTAVLANSGNGGHTRPVDSNSNGYAGSSGIVIVRWGGYSKNYNPTTNAVS